MAGSYMDSGCFHHGVAGRWNQHDIFYAARRRRYGITSGCQFCVTDCRSCSGAFDSRWLQSGRRVYCRDLLAVDSGLYFISRQYYFILGGMV